MLRQIVVALLCLADRAAADVEEAGHPGCLIVYSGHQYIRFWLRFHDGVQLSILAWLQSQMPDTDAREILRHQYPRACLVWLSMWLQVGLQENLAVSLRGVCE